jgi:hypothetical protein
MNDSENRAAAIAARKATFPPGTGVRIVAWSPSPDAPGCEHGEPGVPPGSTGTVFVCWDTDPVSGVGAVLEDDIEALTPESGCERAAHSVSVTAALHTGQYDTLSSAAGMFAVNAHEPSRTQYLFGPMNAARAHAVVALLRGYRLDYRVTVEWAWTPGAVARDRDLPVVPATHYAVGVHELPA